jgi:hypothetical protein
MVGSGAPGESLYHERGGRWKSVPGRDGAFSRATENLEALPGGPRQHLLHDRKRGMEVQIDGELLATKEMSVGRDRTPSDDAELEALPGQFGEQAREVL